MSLFEALKSIRLFEFLWFFLQYLVLGSFLYFLIQIGLGVFRLLKIKFFNKDKVNKMKK